MEELFWGDAGIGLAIVGTTLASAAVLGNGTNEQLGEWAPQMFGTETDIKLASLCVSEPNAGSDVSSMKTRAVYEEADDTWVAQRRQDLGDQRRHRRRARRGRQRRPELKARGQASFVIGPEFKGKGLSQGQKFKKHGIRASHTAEVILDDLRLPGSALLGGKEKLDARLARVREGKKAGGQAAMATFEASRPAVAAQAVGDRPGRAGVLGGVRQDPRAVRPPDRDEPGHRLHPRRHGRPGGRRPAADLAGGLDGAQPGAVRRRPRAR